MPRFDGTGPSGFGPGTGRGLGSCGGGMAYGRKGIGRRLGQRRFWENIPKQEEKETLSEEADILKQELKAIQSRLDELKGQKK